MKLELTSFGVFSLIFVRSVASENSENLQFLHLLRTFFHNVFKSLKRENMPDTLKYDQTNFYSMRLQFPSQVYVKTLCKKLYSNFP